MVKINRPDLIVQVSGPPCSGKSTWIRANTTPADRVMDDNDLLAKPAGGRDRITDAQWRQWHRDLDAAIRAHTGPGRLVFIQGNPTPRFAGITVHTTTATAAECHERATRDGRPEVTHAWIDKWFAKYAAGWQRSRDW